MNSQPSVQELTDKISTGINLLGLDANKLPVNAYVTYLQLLTEWNNAYNLTAIRETDAMVSHHILDSLAVLSFVRGNRCIDIGTGAGLPGLILALSEPARYWDLLDSNHKKIRFLNQVILELEIKNVGTVCCRAEAFNTDKPYSTITTRAFSHLAKMIKNVRHLMANDGVLLALKGENFQEETGTIDPGAFKVQNHALKVPGITKSRYVVEIFPLPVAD